MQLTAETVDEYQGFQYVIPQREASHKAPYVKVRWQNAGVAYILLKTGEINFYPSASKEARLQKQAIEEWFKKNVNACKRIWNKYNGVKI